MGHSAHFLSLYIAEHTQFVPKAEKLSAANQNRARKKLILRQPIRIEHEKTLQLRQPIRIEHERTLELRQPIRIEHEKTLQLRQPIRIEYYVTRVVSQSESSITSPESSRLGWRTLLGSSRLAIAYLNT